MLTYKIKRWVFPLFLLLHTIASFYYISCQNITFDEPQYIEYAKRWLHGHPERINPLDDSKSPVIAVCWLPRIVRQLINPAYKLSDYGRKDQAEGRYMMIMFSWLAALYMYRWCRQLYGIAAWVPALVLLLFDPLYLAYSTLITTDLACGAFLVALLYHYRQYMLNSSIKQLSMAALYTGLGIVTKQTMVFALLLLPVLSVIYCHTNNRLKNVKKIKVASHSAVFIIIVLLVINSMYYFSHSFITLGQYRFESNAFTGLQHSISLLHWLPVPLPQAYIQSLDLLTRHAEYGAGKPLSTYNGVYLFGHLNTTSGYWYYYIITLFYKMPLGTIALSMAAAILFIKKFNSRRFYSTYIFLLLPIIFFAIILSFFNHFQTGARHILLVFPLMYIGLGRLFAHIANINVRYKILSVATLCYSIISMLLYYPFIIPYTNEFGGNKMRVYTKMMDSGIDYGQADSAANDFVRMHNGYATPSVQPAAGKFAIPMRQIVKISTWNSYQYEWYQKIQPAGLYRNVVLLYDIKKEDLQRAGLLK